MRKQFNFFANCNTLEELKKEYKKLALQHHPDRGGNLEIMQMINAEYDEIFPLLKNKHNTDNVKNQTAEEINEFKDIINELIKFAGIDIEICGTWLYVGGNTYAIKDTLKSLGFHWGSQKKLWYKKPENYVASKHKSWSMDEIRNTYGSQKIQTNKQVYALA